jgi:hypothetical protein
VAVVGVVVAVGAGSANVVGAVVGRVAEEESVRRHDRETGAANAWRPRHGQLQGIQMIFNVVSLTVPYTKIPEDHGGEMPAFNSLLATLYGISRATFLGIARSGGPCDNPGSSPACRPLSMPT